jgi:hypothetical protein
MLARLLDDDFARWWGREDFLLSIGRANSDRRIGLGIQQPDILDLKLRSWVMKNYSNYVRIAILTFLPGMLIVCSCG